MCQIRHSADEIGWGGGGGEADTITGGGRNVAYVIVFVGGVIISHF